MCWKYHLLSVHIVFDRANITSGIDGSEERSKQGGLDPSSYKPASMAALISHTVRFMQKYYGARPPFHVPVVGAGQTNQFQVCPKSCLCAKPDPANLEPGEVARKLRLRSTCYPAHRRTIDSNYGLGRNSATCCKAAQVSSNAANAEVST